MSIWFAYFNSGRKITKGHNLSFHMIYTKREHKALLITFNPCTRFFSFSSCSYLDKHVSFNTSVYLKFVYMIFSFQDNLVLVIGKGVLI